MVPIETGKPYFNMVLIVENISILLFSDLGRDLYMVHIRSRPANPANREAVVRPVTAPRVPKPKSTSATIRAVLAID